jgi:hypothetical protein
MAPDIVDRSLSSDSGDRTRYANPDRSSPSRRIAGHTPDGNADIRTGRMFLLTFWPIILLAALVAPAFAQPYSMRLGPTWVVGVTGVFPANVPLSNYQWEAGISKASGTFGNADGGSTVFHGYNVECTLIAYSRTVPPPKGVIPRSPAGVTLRCRDTNGGGVGPTLDITGYSDVRFRWIRNINSPGLLDQHQYLELWDGQGANYQMTNPCVGSGGSGCDGQVIWNYPAGQGLDVVGWGAAFDIRFLRWGPVTVTRMGTKPPVEVPSVHASYMEFNLENSLADTSGRGLNITIGGSGTCSTNCTFVSSPTYGPIAGFGGDQIGLAANQTITLDGTYSFSSKNLNGVPASYAWTLASKQYAAMDGTLGSPIASTTAMVLNDKLGTYVVSLVVTDSNGTSPPVTSKICAVPENADHTLKYYPNPATGVDSPDIRFQTGKLYRYGTSAYPAVDSILKLYAEQLDFHIPLAGTTAYSGTVHVTNSGGIYHVICDTPGTCGFASHWRNYWTGGALTSIVVASNVATATISAPHGFIVGRRLTISQTGSGAMASSCPGGADLYCHGYYVVTGVPTATTLTFTTSGVPNGTYTASNLHLTGGVNEPNSGLPLANYFCLGSCPSYVPLADSNLTSIVVAGTTATVTTAVPHGLEVGQMLNVGATNVPGLDSLNWIISAVPTTTTFQFSTVPIRGGVTETSVVPPGTYTVSQSYIEAEESDYIFVWWNAPGDGKGRYTDAAVAVNSDNDITISTGALNNTSINDASTGHQFSKGSRLEISAGWTNSNASWTYYEAPLALFRQFLQTGLDTYLTKFRNVTDTQWSIALDHGFSGYAFGESRVFALYSVIVRALDAYPQWWPGIVNKLDNGGANPCRYNTAALPQGYGFAELRDYSYYLMYNAAVARSAMTSGGAADTTTRATYCTYTRQCVNNVFASTQLANGSWVMDPSNGNRGYPYAGPGVYTWMMGLTTSGLAATHILMTDGVSCPAISDKAAVAATALSTLKSAIDFQLTQGYDSNLGAFYSVNFTYAPNGGSADELGGTITVTNGSPAVTGSGTTFLSSFLPNGATLLQVDDTHTAIGQGIVSSVASNTAMTLSAPWSGGTPALGYSKSSSCATVTGSGTLHLTNNSSNVTYTGATDLRTIFLPDATTYLQPYSLTNRSMFHIRGVTANTLTLGYYSNGNPVDEPWQGTNLDTTTWKRVNGGCTDVCGPKSTAASCAGFASGGGLPYGGGFIGDAGNNIEQLHGIGYYYSVSGDASYKTQLSDLLNHTFYPGMQPYLPQLAKQYGQIGGAGNNPNALAYLAVVGPCSTLSFAPTSASAAIGGATGTFDATVTDSSCDRSVTSSAPSWLTCTANCSGTGSVTGIGWTAAANAGTARSATLTGGGVSFTVTQSGSVTCTYSLAPTSHNYPATGAAQSVTLTASDSSCAWTATYPDAWLTGSASGTGTQTFNVTAAANVGSSRSSTATIAGQSYAATQDAAGVTGGPSTLISGGYLMTGGVIMQ